MDSYRMILRIGMFARDILALPAVAFVIAMVLVCTGCAGGKPYRSSATTDESSALHATSSAWPAADQVAELRAASARWSALRMVCEHNLNYTPQPVADFSPPRHYVDRAGEQRIARYLTADGGVAYREALCFTLSDDVRYAKVAERILDAWATGVKHIGSEQGVADFNFTFSEYTLAAAMLRADTQWQDAAFRTFLRERVLPLSTASHANNFGNWGVLLEASSASYLQDRALLQHAAGRWQQLMQSEVEPDGSMPREICRSNTTDLCGGADKGVNGLSYTHYALLPTALAAEVFRNTGIDVYATAGGKKLAVAYAQAAAWTLRPETFPYYASNGGHLNGVRNAAYFRILQRRVPCADGEVVLRQGNLAMDGYQLAPLYGDGQ
jgi:Alginate lyase